MLKKIYSIGKNHNINRNISNKKKLSLQKWFYDNYMVLIPGKCGYMSFGANPDKSDLILEYSTKISSAEEYLVLGVTIDNRLIFYNHLKNLCKKIETKQLYGDWQATSVFPCDAQILPLIDNIQLDMSLANVIEYDLLHDVLGKQA